MAGKFCGQNEIRKPNHGCHALVAGSYILQNDYAVFARYISSINFQSLWLGVSHIRPRCIQKKMYKRVIVSIVQFNFQASPSIRGQNITGFSCAETNTSVFLTFQTQHHPAQERNGNEERLFFFSHKDHGLLHLVFTAGRFSLANSFCYHFKSAAYQHRWRIMT